MLIVRPFADGVPTKHPPAPGRAPQVTDGRLLPAIEPRDNNKSKHTWFMVWARLLRSNISGQLVIE